MALASSIWLLRYALRFDKDRSRSHVNVTDLDATRPARRAGQERSNVTRSGHDAASVGGSMSPASIVKPSLPSK
jgi:hypothetical protein